ncbi:MAG: LD-carboxypeptidase [Victivallales bacterium]|nr:LD-carboxypeptidase [Victivallales bacterium]
MFRPFPDFIRKIAVVSLGSPPDKSRIGVFLELMERFGVECLIPDFLFLPGTDSVIPAASRHNAKDFAACWRDESVDLIISARGGYGSARLFESIQWDALPCRDIPVLGYSDITAFHLAMLKCGKGIPVATPMAQDIPAVCVSDRASASMRGAIERALSQSVCKRVPALEFPGQIIEKRDLRKVWIMKPGRASGRLIPANLTAFASLVGTHLMPSLQGAIPLFEDVGEPPYKIARCLNQIRQSGHFAKFAGIALGSFRNCGPESLLRDVFADFAESFNGPVLGGVPFGHLKATLSFVVGEKVMMCAYKYPCFEEVRTS